MKGDGVCDERLNNEPCLFDGGDCCLEFKSTPLCIEDCSCKLVVDKSVLAKKLSENKVQLILDDEYRDAELQDNIVITYKYVTSVTTANVCSLLCIEPEIERFVNAWIFDGDCSCLWMSSLYLCAQAKTENLISYDESEEGAGVSVFLKFSNSPDCGKLD